MLESSIIQRLSRAALPAAAAVAALLSLVLAARAWLHPPGMLLAPMIGLAPCMFPGKPDSIDRPLPGVAEVCAGPAGSSAALIESTLQGIEAPDARQSYELGYTLNVPLLTLFRPVGQDWVIHEERIGHLVRTVRDSPRPVVLYFFSTHFSQAAEIEKVLAADPANLGVTPAGPLGQGTYYGSPIYNWSFATTNTDITRRRVQAANAFMAALCQLSYWDRRKVRAFTLLGETHHLFPDFEAGMGFGGRYLVTDYSEASRRDFRAFLRERFGTIEKLNAQLGSGWASFDAIEPPAKDIRKEPLQDFTEHIDSFAHGFAPMTGWAHVRGRPESTPAVVRVYRNGVLAGRALVDKHRQDVLVAHPTLGTANTGWRWDLDFRKLPPGIHQIDFLLETGPDDLVHFLSRKIVIVDRSQATPQPQPMAPLPKSRAPDDSFLAHVDQPVELASYYYNPMAPLWHEFRGLQVVRYLQAFDQAVPRACFGDTPRYTHQILPHSNPGWDETKFAIDASLAGVKGLQLGVSLYGEPTYGQSFLRWMRASNHTAYGITEFHPLRGLSPEDLAGVFRRHDRAGARFLSFFMEPRWRGQIAARERNLFSFDADNRQFGSDVLFRSTRQVLDGSARPPAAPAVTAPAAAARSAP